MYIFIGRKWSNNRGRGLKRIIIVQGDDGEM